MQYPIPLTDTLAFEAVPSFNKSASEKVENKLMDASLTNAYSSSKFSNALSFACAANT